MDTLNKIEIGNSIEGPVLLRAIGLSSALWKDKLHPRRTDDQTVAWDKNDSVINPFRQTLIDNVSANIKQPTDSDPILIALKHPGDSEYVYRCVDRAENGQDSLSNINQYGYEKSPTEDDTFWYSIGKAHFPTLWSEKDKHTSYILIYHNNPEVFTKQDRRYEGFIALRNHKAGTPSLRDLLIGVIKIDWK